MDCPRNDYGRKTDCADSDGSNQSKQSFLRYFPLCKVDDGQIHKKCRGTEGILKENII